MINTAVVWIVDLCARHRWQVIVAGTLVMLGAGAGLWLAWRWMFRQ